MTELAENEAPSSKKGFIIFVVAVLFMGAGAGVAWHQGLFTKEKGAKRNVAKVMGPVVGIDRLVVNLDEPGGRRYLKVSLDLELEAELNNEQKKLLTRLRDTILLQLSALNVADAQKISTKAKLKKDILAEANKVFGAGSTRAVYLKEFVIQ